MIKAMGGRSALEALRYLQFDFVIEVDGKETARRTHQWDRQAGLARVDGELTDGRLVTALINTQTGAVQAYVGAQPNLVQLDDPEILQHCAVWNAQAEWWLLGPTLLARPGVQVHTEPAVEIDSISLPTVAVDFAPGSGPLAGDRYWFHIDPASDLPYASSFVLGGELTAPTTVIWKQWVKVHDFLLPTRFLVVRSRRIIGIDKLNSPDLIHPQIFLSPDLPMGEDARSGGEPAPAAR